MGMMRSEIPPDLSMTNLMGLLAATVHVGVSHGREVSPSKDDLPLPEAKTIVLGILPLLHFKLGEKLFNRDIRVCVLEGHRHKEYSILRR